MGALASWLMGAFGSIFAFFATYVTRKTALSLAVITIVAGMSLALYTGMKLLVGGLVSLIVNEWILIGMSVIWPSNAEACISAMFSADAAIWLYRNRMYNIKIVLNS